MHNHKKPPPLQKANKPPCGAVPEQAAMHLAGNTIVCYTRGRSIGEEEDGFSVASMRSFFLMKVILLQDVEGLGKAGDLKDVANGYARNYLLPRQLAAGATPSLVANRQQRIAAEQRKLEKQADQNRQQAERLGQISLTFKARVGREGRLYGSITSQDIAAGLRDSEGIIIDRRMIDLPEPIRTVGTFTVPVKIAQKLAPKITVNVVDQSEGATASEAENAAVE